ncbi:MAG: CBS domain-containing protein [Candidatus Limnocylindrales bacterium]
MVRLPGRGIRVRATTGWLITYVLLVVTLVLWRELPAAGLGSDLERWVAVLLVPLLLFPTLLAHELAHVAVARHLGSSVHEVDLRMVGMSRGNAEAPGGAAGEARIALAGPLVSLALAAGLLALMVVLERADGLLMLAGWTVGCVAIANLVLGLASLYPGYPMDGSDVVHALAWRVTGSRERAARAVVQVGVVAGWCVMLTGIAVALRVDPTAGMWLTLLGWALGRISRNARDHERLTELVSGLTVGDATQRDVAVVTPGLTLDTVVAQDQLTDGPGMFPVVRGGALVGVIDLRDVGRAGRSGTVLRVADRMRSIDRVHVVTEGQRLWDAVAILERDRVNAVPVVATDDRARLLGLVTRSAVQRLLRARTRGLGPTDAPPDEAEAGETPDGSRP